MPSKDKGKKRNKGYAPIYRRFIEEWEDEDSAILIIDDKNPHNKGEPNSIELFIRQMTPREDASEMDILFELMSLLPIEKK